jgi:hypothetical protein
LMKTITKCDQKNIIYEACDCFLGVFYFMRQSCWQIAIEVLAHTCNLESCIGALEQILSETKGDARQFVPIRFVPLNKITIEHKYGLAFDAWVLSEMLGHEITVGRIIHGDGHATLSVNVAPCFVTFKR